MNIRQWKYDKKRGWKHYALRPPFNILLCLAVVSIISFLSYLYEVSCNDIQTEPIKRVTDYVTIKQHNNPPVTINFNNKTREFMPRRDIPELAPQFINRNYPQRLRRNERTVPAVYILSAIVSNTTKRAGYTRDVKVNAWVDTYIQRSPISCCILWRDDTISKIDSTREFTFTYQTQLKAFPFVCPFNRLATDIVGVTLELTKNRCPRPESNLYIKPYHPQKHPDEWSFGVCLKILFSHKVENALLMDWLEYLRHIKVDKVFVSTYEVSDATMTILRRYERMGFLERRYFNNPGQKSHNLYVGLKNDPVWGMERLISYDCARRLVGYKFMMIIDMDEFLVPRKHDNIKDLMRDLMKSHPNAAGFNLPSYLFLKEIAPDPQADKYSSAVMKYFKRTPALRKLARTKNIILPLRSNIKGLETHGFMPTGNYEKVEIDIKAPVVAINHYRKCYPELKHICKGKLIYDTFILKFFNRFKNSVVKKSHN